ncbi:hypothetical protein [Photorhabdus heterorhabditis]|nr:hypothetical protein [Photorhabdus heterorhabditis]
MLNEGKSPQEISAALSKHAKGDHPEGQDPARGLLVAWGAGASVVGGTIVGPITGAAAVIGGGILGGATDVTKQFLTLKPGEHYSATDTLIAVGTGALTQGKGTLFSTLVNTGGAYLGSKVKGEDPTTSMLGNAVGTVIGNKVGGSLPMKCFLKVILIKLPRLVGKLCWSCNRLHCRRRYKENTRKKKINNKRSVIFRLKQFIYLILGWGIVFSVCCMISIPLAYLIIFFKENNAFHCEVDRQTPISPMPSVSYHPFFSMCVHRRTQNPLTRFSPPKAGFSRRAVVSVAPFSATGERRPTRLGGGRPFCGRGRHRARKRRPCDARGHCGFGLRMTLHDHAVLFREAPGGCTGRRWRAR